MRTRPNGWGQDSIDALDALFERARKDGLWFYHGGLSGPLWFSPDELEAQHAKGSFIWGAVNWDLRDPREQLDRATKAVHDAKAERAAVAERLIANGVLANAR